LDSWRRRYIQVGIRPRKRDLTPSFGSDSPVKVCCIPGCEGIFDAEVYSVTDWPVLDADTMKKVKKQIDTGWSLHLNDF
jgi:hypothetical protein